MRASAADAAPSPDPTHRSLVASQHDPRVALVGPVRHAQSISTTCGCGSRSGRTRARPARTTTRSKPEKLEAVQVDDRGHAADRGEVAVVAVAERRRRGLRPASRARITRATCAPICLAAGATPGTGLPSSARVARSPATKISGWPGSRGRARPARGPRDRSGTPSCAPSGEAATPAAHSTVRAAMRSLAQRVRPMRRCACTGVPVRTSTPRRCELRARLRRQRFRETSRARAARLRSAARARAPGRCGGTRCAACGARSRPACRPARRPVGPPPTTAKVEPAPRASRGIGFGFGALEREQHAAADRERIVERLQARRVRRPVVVAEIGVRRAAWPRAGSRSRAPCRSRACSVARGLVDRRRLRPAARDVALPAQDVAQRRGDVGRGQAGGRDLVEQAAGTGGGCRDRSA